MSDEKPPLDAALRRLAERERRTLTEHPPPAELEAYHLGRLSPEAEERLREHLSVCRLCSDLLLDIAGEAELRPPPGVAELTDEEVEEDWQALRARLREEPGGRREEGSVVPIRPAVTPVIEIRGVHPLLAVAASLLAVIGVSWALYLGRQLDQARQPTFPGVYRLEPVTRSAEEPRLSIPAERDVAIFLEPVERYPSYRIEVRQDEEVLWESGTISAEDFDAYPFLPIKAGFLKPGDYRILMHGIDGSGSETVLDRNMTVNAS